MRILDRLKAYFFPERPALKIPCEFFGGPFDGGRRLIYRVVVEGGACSYRMPSGNLALYRFEKIVDDCVDGQFDTVLVPERELK